MTAWSIIVYAVRCGCTMEGSVMMTHMASALQHRSHLNICRHIYRQQMYIVSRPADMPCACNTSTRHKGGGLSPDKDDDVCLVMKMIEK